MPDSFETFACVIGATSIGTASGTAFGRAEIDDGVLGFVAGRHSGGADGKPGAGTGERGALIADDERAADAIGTGTGSMTIGLGGGGNVARRGKPPPLGRCSPP